MFQELKEIYKYFEDDESREIFKNRLLYGLTGDWKYLKEMLLYYHQPDKGYADLLDVLAKPEEFRGKKIILFGTSVWGWAVARWFNICQVEYFAFCDNNPNKVGQECCGKKIISAEELFRDHRDAMIAIATEKYEHEILAQLRQEQVPEEQIIRLSFSKDKMYIDDRIMKPIEDEIFIDGGCYDGESSFDFINWANGKVKKVYAFEPDGKNFSLCEKNFTEKCKVDYRLLPFGLWSEKTTLKFAGDAGVGSRVGESENSVEIKTASIDETVGDDKVTFIKLDVEGAELETLKGAAGTIRKHKPRLAVCLYHKPEDIVEIPKYIKELVPEYKLYIKHYYPYVFDTVLYAVIDE